MNWIWYFFLALVILLLIGLQSTFFTYLPVGGVILQIVPIFLLGLALFRLKPFILVLAFVAGLLLDLLSIAPLGSTAVSLLCALALIYPFSRAIEQYRFPTTLILSLMGMFVFFFANNLTLYLIGVSLDWNVMATLPRIALVHAFGSVIIALVLGSLAELFGRNRRKNSF